MIEIIGSGVAAADGGGFDSFEIEGQEQFGDNIEMPLDVDAEFNINAGPNGESSLTGSVVDYIVSSKNSLIQKNLDIQESYLGDNKFDFKDKMQLLEKTYSYQLEMTFYNTFMAQTMQKVDSLIQLK